MKKLALILFLSLGINILFAADKGITDLQVVKAQVEQGFAQARFNLGLMYEDGKGVKQDLFEAVKWYRLAAEQGYTSAQTNLGIMYSKGEGVKQDKFEAAKWWRLAASQGNGYAQTNLGGMYENGDGVKQDIIEAKKWFAKACDNGVEKGCQAYKKLNEAGY